MDLIGEDNKYPVHVNRNPEQYGSTSDETDLQDLNMLLNYWTKPSYDYYNEWLGETVNTLKRAGQISDSDE